MWISVRERSLDEKLIAPGAECATRPNTRIPQYQVEKIRKKNPDPKNGGQMRCFDWTHIQHVALCDTAIMF